MRFTPVLMKKIIPKHRIVSLLPSNTETICALGYGDLLVGRSHECEYPSWVKSLPVCSKEKMMIRGTCSKVDEDIKKVLENALSVFAVKPTILNKLKPSLIVTQDHCGVCAVSLADVEGAVNSLIASQPKVVSVHPHDLEGIYRSFKEIAAAIGDVKAGDRLVAHITSEFAKIKNKLRDGATVRKGANKASATSGTAKVIKIPRVAPLEWIDPIFISGGWFPELVTLAGGIDVLGKPGERSKGVHFETLEKAKPDVIVIAPCSYDIPKTLKELPALTRHPHWAKLKAVRNKQVYVADGKQFFNRPGPRILESAQILAEILHPELFSFGHKTSGWVKLDEVTSKKP